MSCFIFISHSSKGSEWDEQFRDQLNVELMNRHYRTYYDVYHVRPGDLWRPTVYRALTECDAAVLLLSRDALRSAWVHTESVILACRRDLHAHFNREFRLLPVLLDGVIEADLELSPPPEGQWPFGHLRLPTLSFRSLSRYGTASLPMSPHPKSLKSFRSARCGTTQCWNGSIVLRDG